MTPVIPLMALWWKFDCKECLGKNYSYWFCIKEQWLNVWKPEI